MKNKLTIIVGLCICFNFYLNATPNYKRLHKTKSRTSIRDRNEFKSISNSRSNYASFASFRNVRKGYKNRFINNGVKKNGIFTKFDLINNRIEMIKNNLVCFNYVRDADSVFKSSNVENRFLISYTKSDKGQFKYKTHIEGCVKVYEGIINSKHSYTYVSMNSAITPNKYIMVPVNKDGFFTKDIEDDSIGSISIIKRGTKDKIIPLKTIDLEKINSYTFDISESNEATIANTTKQDTSKKIRSVNLMPAKTAKIYFEFNKSTLKFNTKHVLDNIIDSLKQENNINRTVLELNGYADKKGSKAFNLYISRMRSLACKKYIVSHGVKNIKIIINAMGNTCSLNENSINNNNNNNNNNFNDNGQKDRRVDIILYSEI